MTKNDLVSDKVADDAIITICFRLIEEYQTENEELKQVIRQLKGI